MMFTRNCPKCNDEIKYKNKRSIWLANKRDAKCKKCYNLEISETLKKRYASGELKVVPPRSDFRERKKYFRNCPKCNSKIGHTKKEKRDQSKKLNLLCNSCSTITHKKSWSYVITDDMIKKMRASKAGFDSWEEYLEKYPEKQFYKREVWRLTYKQPIRDLQNWNKRGRCGVKGAYQLDHIISINEGWENSIDPQVIAHIDNLRMIPWKQNRNKGVKNDINI